MEPIHVIVCERTIAFRATATVEGVENKIRESCGLQHGRLEDQDGVALVNSDTFAAGATYKFVDGIERGK
jgi:hypothetical protein